MTSILVYLSDQTARPNWTDNISQLYSLHFIKEIPTNNKSIIIVDTANLENHEEFFMPFSQLNFRCLIVGNLWPDDKQVSALVSGAAGYCDINESATVINQALNSISKGEIWIQKHLVQRVIGSLVKLNSRQQAQKPINNIKIIQQLNKLSARELDVAKMLKTGESNKKIAQHLGISERTVKAHLTSIFKKLEVSDRLQLALFIQESAV